MIKICYESLRGIITFCRRVKKFASEFFHYIRTDNIINSSVFVHHIRTDNMIKSSVFVHHIKTDNIINSSVFVHHIRTDNIINSIVFVQSFCWILLCRVLTVSANQKKKIFCRKLNLVERNIECNFSVLRYKRKPNVSGSLNTFENG